MLEVTSDIRLSSKTVCRTTNYTYRILSDLLEATFFSFVNHLLIVCFPM